MTEGADARPTGRRAIVKGAAGLAALGAAGGATRLFAGPRTDAGIPGLVLDTHTTPGMGSLEVPVSSDLVQAVGSRQWRSGRLDATRYSMVAFIWDAKSLRIPELRVRARQGGHWGSWRRVPPIHGGIDAASEPKVDHTGTELVWVGPSDGIEFAVSRARPKSLTMVLLHPEPGTTDAQSRPSGARGAARAPVALAPVAESLTAQPDVLSRAQWGADESWRDGAPRYNHLMQQVHIHHTASGNDYTADQVPGLIRGMYRYHTHYLGWSDIAYNFLVDRFGRVWEGRAGGINRPVRGAHTRGFNTTSAGIAVIGNFEEVVPSPAIIGAVAAVAGWKVDGFGGRPRGSVAVRSDGSDKFPAHDVALLRVIDGHRDTNDTACPGRHLYDALPQIRRQAKATMLAANPVVVVAPAAVDGKPTVGSALTLRPGRYSPADASLAVTWMRDGAVIDGATAPTHGCTAADFGTRLSVRIEASAPGRGTAIETLSMPTPVTARPDVRIRTSGGRGRAAVRVRVVPPEGVSVVAEGNLVITVGRLRQTVELVAGRAVVRFGDLRPGLRPVTVSYSGDGGLEGSDTTSSVRVRRTMRRRG